MRPRRLRKEVPHLEITAFINLIVVLVPFLLSTAVFTRLSVIDLSLPAKSTGAVEQLKVNDLKLEIVLRPDALEVGDRIGGLIQRIPNASGGYDLMVVVEGSDLREVARFVSEKLSTMDGVISTATHFRLKTYKENGFIFGESSGPERLAVSP